MNNTLARLRSLVDPLVEVVVWGVLAIAAITLGRYLLMFVLAAWSIR